MSGANSIILYDFLLVKGGAEAVTLDLCAGVPSLDLGVGFIDRKLFEQDPIDSKRIHCLSGSTTIVGWQILKAALFFRYKGDWLVKYQRVIFSGICTPLAVAHCQTDAIKLMYCHTPPRFIYDLRDHYLNGSSILKRTLIKRLTAYLKPRYEKAITQMDLIVANSINVQQRLKKYLGVDAIVIYPPCHIDRYGWIEQGDFYLSTARLEAYKRVDLLVEAFINMPDKKLVVASGGSELQKLRKRAAGAHNISFTGWCVQAQLETLMGKCIATIYLPMDEDFGISPVESMAAGKPVIGVCEGGVMETVIDGVTGLLCPASPTLKNIVTVVKKMTPARALLMRQACEQRAVLFSTATFLAKMTQLLECQRDSLLLTAAQIDASC